MSRFSDILKGTRAIKRVVCPVVNVTANATAGASEVPSQFECGVRVLSVEEQEVVYEKALVRTKRLGGEEREDSALYNLSLQIYTIAAAYVDPDSDPASAKLYFGDTIDAAAECISKSELLSRDTLAYLAEVQEVWQDWCNPQTNPKQNEMLKYVEEVAKDASSFLYLRPGAQVMLASTICKLYLASQKDSSEHISFSEPSTTEDSKPKPKKASERQPAARKSSRRRR